MIMSKFRIILKDATFFWIFYMITAPLLLLFNMFAGTSRITTNLFRGMIEVASWKIVWAILSAMLTALSFGNAYQAEGNYLTLIVMNFVISLAMLATPIMVKSIVGHGVQSMASTLGPATAVAMVAAPARAATALTTTRTVMHNTATYARSKLPNIKPKFKI